MALTDIHNRVRSILYGHGLGEKPSVRLAAADAAEDTSSDPLVSFALASGEGAKVKQSNTLAAYSPGDADAAFVIYVTDVATDTVTGVNGGLIGAPVVTVAGSLDSVILEQNPLVSSFDIHKAIETIVARHLWPEVYHVETKVVSTPDIVDGQEAVEADVMEILSAWQVIGPDNVPIAAQRRPVTVNTSQKSTGRMAAFDWYDGSVGYYTAKCKVTVADDDGTPDLTTLIATGAAALALGGTYVEATLGAPKRDNEQAASQRSQVAGLLWRDFLTLKQEYSRELGREHESSIVIDRG